MSISTLESPAAVRALDRQGISSDEQSGAVRRLADELLHALRRGDLSRSVGPRMDIGRCMTAMQALEYGVGWEDGPSLSELLQIVMLQIRGVDQTLELAEFIKRAAMQWADQMVEEADHG